MRKLKDKTLFETGRQLTKEEAATAWKSLQQEMQQRIEAEQKAELKQRKENLFKRQEAPAPAPEPDHKHKKNVSADVWKQRQENKTQRNDAEKQAVNASMKLPAMAAQKQYTT